MCPLIIKPLKGITRAFCLVLLVVAMLGFFQQDAQAQTPGWVQYQNAWYFVDANGTIAANRWVQYNKNWYNLKNNAKMASSEWIEWGGSSYYFKANGQLAVSEWVPWSGSWMYLDGKGQPLKDGWAYYKGFWYRTTSTGTVSSSTYPVCVYTCGIPTSEGTIRGALYFPYTSEKVPLLIYSHGLATTGATFLQNARELAAQGVACYVFDFIGGSTESASGGDTTSMSLLTEKQQLTDIINAAKRLSLYDKNKIYLAGYSLGGLVSTMIASERNDIAGIILFAPALNLGELSRTICSWFTTLPETLEVNGTVVGQRFAEDVWDVYIQDVVAAYTGPSLVFHGANDIIITAEVSRYAKSIWGDACSLVIDSDGNHLSVVDYDYSNVSLMSSFIQSR